MNPRNVRQHRHPLSHADRARAAGRLLAVDRQPRQSVSVHQGSAAARRLQRDHQAGCFADGGVLGRIPQSRLYQPGLASSTGGRSRTSQNVPAGQAYNYEVTDPSINLLGYQPIIRLDYQPFNEPARQLQVSSSTSSRTTSILGHPAGIQRHAAKTTTASGCRRRPSTGRSTRRRSSRRACGRELPPPGRLLGHRRLAELLPQRRCRSTPSPTATPPASAAIPYLFPDATILEPGTFSYEVVSRSDTTIWDGTRVLGAPAFTWGSRVANAPPNNQGPFSNFILDTRVYNFNASLTKVTGSPHVQDRLLLLQQLPAPRPGRVPRIDQLPERHQQPARHRVRVRQRGARHLQLVLAAVALG